METQKSFFDALPSKQSFWLGFVTAILAMGTLGFILLGSCVLGDDCAVDGLALGSSADAEEVADAQVAAVPTPTATGIPAVTEADYIRGDINAPITIIEYTDFECPYCERFHPTMEQVMEEYDGQVRWVLRHFPLSFHANANSAALATECAGEQGNDYFWEMGDALFDNRATLGSELYAQIASDIGLNTTDFNDCMENEEYMDKIEAQAQAGGAAGVSGTPGSFVIDQNGNAIPIKGALPFSSVAAAIDSVL